MKIMTIQVPDDSVDFVEEFVERIGGVWKQAWKRRKKRGKHKLRNISRLIFLVHGQILI